jgi:S1-C subfamily serine protease
VAIDLVILEASGELGTDLFLRLSSQRVPGLGDTVFTIGYPTPDLLDTDPKHTNGTVIALSGLRGDAGLLQISVSIQPGNSGGALVNDDGDLIGVVVATASAPAFIRATDFIPQNINWAVKNAFASVLFEPPSSDRTPTADADTTVIERVTAATCLVRVTGPAQQIASLGSGTPRTRVSRSSSHQTACQQ